MVRHMAGDGRRRLIGQIAVGQGIAYLLIVLFDRPLTGSYARQAAFAPLWVWVLALLVLGGLFWWSATRYRRHIAGRLVAALMLGLQVWFAVSFAMAGALVAVGQYIPICAVVFAEAVFIREGVASNAHDS